MQLSSEQNGKENFPVHVTLEHAHDLFCSNLFLSAEKRNIFCKWKSTIRWRLRTNEVSPLSCLVAACTLLCGGGREAISLHHDLVAKPISSSIQRFLTPTLTFLTKCAGIRKWPWRELGYDPPVPPMVPPLFILTFFVCYSVWMMVSLNSFDSGMFRACLYLAKHQRGLLSTFLYGVLCQEILLWSLNCSLWKVRYLEFENWNEVAKENQILSSWFNKLIHVIFNKILW